MTVIVKEIVGKSTKCRNLLFLDLAFQSFNVMENGQGNEGGDCAFAMDSWPRTLLHWILCSVSLVSCTFLLSCLVLEKGERGVRLLALPRHVSLKARARSFFFFFFSEDERHSMEQNKQTKPNQTIEEVIQKQERGVDDSLLPRTNGSFWEGHDFWSSRLCPPIYETAQQCTHSSQER